MASVSKLDLSLGAISGAGGSSSAVVLEQLTVDHVLFLNVSAFSTTTLTVNVMSSPDGTNFAQIATVNLTATGKSVLAVPTPMSHVKIDWTMVGGAQTATVSAALCYDKRR
jgi:hypothetical protein